MEDRNISGTKTGARKASLTNKERYGKDFYRIIGAIGGASSGLGGFGSPKTGKDGLTGSERASIAGRKGGLKSKRRKSNER